MSTVLQSLHQQRALILELAARHGARRLRVFGSVARGEERADSDVDLLVDLPPGYDLLGQRMALAERLEALLGRPVDLVPEHELSRHLRSRVLAEARDL